MLQLIVCFELLAFNIFTFHTLNKEQPKHIIYVTKTYDLKTNKIYFFNRYKEKVLLF